MKQLKIDPELRDLLPPLTPEEYAQLEKNILTNGYDRNFPIMEWNGYIVDGHNRYQICQDNNITDYVVGTLAYETKEEVMEWMLDIQLGRRNLTPMQRISIAEKYRGIYEKQAKEAQSNAGKEYGLGGTKLMANLPEALDSDKKEPNPTTRKKLADLAGVGERTYAKGVAILNSGNEELKKRVLSGETKIDAGYKELTGKNKKQSVSGDSESSCNSEVSEVFDNSEISTVQDSTEVQDNPTDIKFNTGLSFTVEKSKVSDEVRQICEELKREKTADEREALWNYRTYVIDCMNGDFESYYDSYVSTLYNMNGRVTKDELDECIQNAKSNVRKLLDVLKAVKSEIELKAAQADMSISDQIRSIDAQIELLEDEMKKINIEQQNLFKQRKDLFSNEEVKCALQYRIDDDGLFYNAEIYLEVDGHSTTLFSGGIYDESPDNYVMRKVPEQYKCDFLMIWRTAYLKISEFKEKRDKQWQNYDEQWKNFSGAVFDYANGLKDIDKSHLKKFYRILVERFHPDNGNGDVELMQSVNKLKRLWDL